MKKYLIILLCLIAKISTAQIIITEINYDTPYSERQLLTPKHHSGEYIELYNYTNEDIPLKGWFITDCVSKYHFPDHAIIKSEDFIIVAYRKNHTENYFPQFFPNTAGQENKIYYQDKLMMNNKRECLNIHYGIIKDIKIKSDENLVVRSGDIRGVSFQKCWLNEYTGTWSGADQTHQEFTIGNSFDVHSLSHLQLNYSFYNTFSYHFNGNNNPLLNFESNSPSPLSSNYLPLTQDLQTITTEIVHPHYDQFTWASHANSIINCNCPLSIPLEFQNPTATYLTSGRCFVYDVNGNATSSTFCTPIVPTNPIITEYTPEEIADFESKINIYPNPTFGAITIDWDTLLVGKITNIAIGNVNGLLVTQQNITPTQASTTFNISTQPMSIYIVKFTLNTGQSISKNIIKL